MDQHIKLIATIQQNLIRVAAELKESGSEDLSILLNLCAEKLNDAGDKRLIKDCIDTIIAEVEKRDRMVVCPKCKTVMFPGKPCEKCGATLERTAP